MTLSITTAEFPKVTNVTLPLVTSLTGATVRLAFQSSGTLGTFKVSGAASTDIGWSMDLQPSWVTIAPNSDSTEATLSFSNAVYSDKQNGLHLFFVQVTDGVDTVRFPIALDVKEPFFIQENPLAATPGTLNFVSYDSSAPEVVVSAYGINGQLLTSQDIQFIPPAVLPSGLRFLTSDGANARFKVLPAGYDGDTSDTSGGVKLTGGQAVTIQAYRPGSMYDSPDRPYVKAFTIQSVSDKTDGPLNAVIGAYYDDTSDHVAIRVLANYIGGKGKTLNYEWSVTGGVPGTPSSLTSQAWTWAPGGTGNATFNLTIKDNATSSTITTRSFTMPVATAGSWVSTSAIKLNVSNDLVTGFNSGQATVTISAPELDTLETANIILTLTPETGSPAITYDHVFVDDVAGLVGGVSYTTTLDGTTPSRVVKIDIPAASAYKTKWKLTVQTDAGDTRQGFAQVIVESAGKAIISTPVVIGGVQTTGSSITPVDLVSTSGGTLSGVSYYLSGAPNGMRVVGNQLVGGALTAKTWNFKLVAVKSGYAESVTNVTLTTGVGQLPLSVSYFNSDTSVAAQNTQFRLSWGINEPSSHLYLQKNFDSPIEVTGSYNSSQILDRSSVFALSGYSFYGFSYSLPSLVVSSSISDLTKLPPSPTVAYIDTNRQLTINWNPVALDGSYALYKGWVIRYQLNGVISRIPSAGAVPTGTGTDSRILTHQLGATSGFTEYLNMQAVSSNTSRLLDSDPWPSFLAFPRELVEGATNFISIDKTSAKLGESVTVILDPAYSAATQWRIKFPDNTFSAWNPISIKSITKAFTTPGTQDLEIQTEYDYSNLSPSVKLRRTAPISVYIQNEQFNPTVDTNQSIGNIGIGGEAGFEISDPNKDSYKLEPYMVVTKALVKDELTQELKLLVATSRNTNASSVLGTMAVDIFPLSGRPHLKELVEPVNSLNGNTNLISPVAITTTALPDIIVGKPMVEVQLQATGGTFPYDWFSDGLPFGLKLSTDGTLSGTPLMMGNYVSNFSVKDSTSPAYIADATLNITVKSDLSINSSTLPDAKVGTYYSNPVLLSGGLPPYTWSLVAGSLPQGLSLNAISGQVLGYPTTYNSNGDFDHVYTFTTEVVDSIGARASKTITMNLLPMDLTLGNLDQPIIFQGEDFKLALPVYGGRSPYSVDSFSSDGSIGNILNIVTPEVMMAVSGKASVPLEILTGDQPFTPVSYPYDLSFTLGAQGGVGNYSWRYDPLDVVNNTLTGQTITGNTVTARPTADGDYKIKVFCTSGSETISKLINVRVHVSASADYSLEFVQINKNSSNYPINWTFTKLSAPPSATQGSIYRPSGSEYYGIMLWNTSTNAPWNTLTHSIGWTEGRVYVGQSSSLPQGWILVNGVGYQGGSYVDPLRVSLATAYFDTVSNIWRDVITGIKVTATVTPYGGFGPGNDTNTGANNISLGCYGIKTANASSGLSGGTISGFTYSGYPNGGMGTATYNTDPHNPYILWLFSDQGTVASGFSSQVFSGTTSFIPTALGNFTLGTWSIMAGTTVLTSKTFSISVVSSGGGTPVDPVILESVGPYSIQVTLGASRPGVPNDAVVYDYILRARGGTGTGYTFELSSDLLGTSDITQDSGGTYHLVSKYRAVVSDALVSWPTSVVITARDSANVASNPTKIYGNRVIQTQDPIIYVSVKEPSLNSLRLSTVVSVDAIGFRWSSNQSCAWDVTGLPTGLSVMSRTDNSIVTSNTQVVPAAGITLYGSPSVEGTYNVSITPRFLSPVTGNWTNVTAETRNLVLTVEKPTAIFAKTPATNLIQGQNYSYATGTSQIQVNYSGFNKDGSLPSFTTSRGTLSGPTIVGLTDLNPGISGYAHSWQANYDFISNTSGATTLTIGTTPVATANFTVSAPQLNVSTLGVVSYNIGEYSTSAFYSAPIQITGGSGNYSYVITSFSSASNFSDPAAGGAGNGQIEFMNTAFSPVLAGQNITCNINYTVTDLTYGGTATGYGSVKVNVLAENYITADTSSNTWTWEAGGQSSYYLAGNVTPGLGHYPIRFSISNLVIPGALSSKIRVTSSGKALMYNANMGINYYMYDFSSNDKYTTPGSSSIYPSGAREPDLVGSALPASGTYTITYDLTLTDANNISLVKSLSFNVVVP